MNYRIRNRECIPYIETEGVFLKPLIVGEYAKKDVTCGGSTIYSRLHRAHTLASARRFAYFKPFTNLTPQDYLDLVLSSTYNQTKEHFADKVDTHLQPETLGIDIWRRLKNTRDLTPDREEQAAAVKAGDTEAPAKRGVKAKRKTPVIPYRYNYAHKVLIGGLAVKKHPSSIKLMNSSHHSPQTNAGYSRQPSDGNFYQY